MKKEVCKNCHSLINVYSDEYISRGNQSGYKSIFKCTSIKLANGACIIPNPNINRCDKFEDKTAHEFMEL